MKLREYSQLTLQQRSLVDRITSASMKNQAYFAQNGYERRMMRRLAELGHGEIMISTAHSNGRTRTDLSLNLR